MKTNFRLMAVTITLLCASLAGCFGDDDSDSDEYDGPIDLVVFYDATSGVIEESYNNNQAGPKTGVELSFDFADTTSDDGDIVMIMMDPDDGTDPIEADPSDNAVLTYTWMTHGVFDVTLSAEDEDGNEHSIMINVKIDMHIIWTDSNTGSSSMDIYATPDCEDGDPSPDKIAFTSTVENPGGFLGPGASSEVVWSFKDPNEEEIATEGGTIGGGSSESWDYTHRDVMDGYWSIDIDVTDGDNVNITNDVTIAYEEGAEDSPNPRD